MRIITGSARGIRLTTLEGEETRPTAERVKEAVFSMLQFDIEERDVLDLFSGSGQMALEALSRGASGAVLIDKSKKAVSIINDNIRKTRLEDRCSVINMDALDYIKSCGGNKFDIIFIDPPYASGLYAKVLRALNLSEMLKPSTLIVCESDYDFISDDPDLETIFYTKKTARYGRSVVTILAPRKDGM